MKIEITNGTDHKIYVKHPAHKKLMHNAWKKNRYFNSGKNYSFFFSKLAFLVFGQYDYKLDKVLWIGRFVIDDAGLRPKANFDYFKKWTENYV